MSAIARGEENTPSKLNWYTTISGVLTDMFEVGFQIKDVISGYPGTQIFPATLGDFENVTTAPGKFSVGSYYAYDNTAGNGWTPSLGEPLGTHVICWRWKVSAASPYQLGQEEFEVLVESAGSSLDTYCTVQDLRDLGLADPPSDALVLKNIQLAQALLDRACRQWFVPKTKQFKFDGTDSDAIHFGIPIIDIEFLRINTSTTNLEERLYRVYKERDMPDDRRNPRIKLIGSSDDVGIYTATRTSGRLRFRKGRHNQEIRGTFGFVEEDGSVPIIIREACCRLAIEKMSSPAYLAPGAPIIPPPPAPIGGIVVEEVTDGHKLKYANATAVQSRRSGMTGVSNDPFVQDAIRMYRAPIGIATPAQWSHGGR